MNTMQPYEYRAIEQAREMDAVKAMLVSEARKMTREPAVRKWRFRMPMPAIAMRMRRQPV